MQSSVTPINTPNNVQNFFPVGKGWELRPVQFKASVAISQGYAVGQEVSASNPTGYATLMPTTQATGQNFVGILAEAIRTTDSDYATAGKIKQVWVPVMKRADCEFKVVTGTFAQADVGRVCQFSSDSAGLNVDANGAGALITKYISATRGECIFDVPLTTTA